MKAYIINLSEASDRRKYMETVLNSYPSIDYEFITAVNGSTLSNLDRLNLFDEEEFKTINGRTPKYGEIGCTLSHRKCFTSLLESTNRMAIVLEDDIEIVNPELTDLLPKIEQLADTDNPIIILLSDWYWYSKSKQFYKNYRTTDVEYGFFAHAYIINRAAAIKALEYPANYIADHWHIYKKMGIKVIGLIPHFINQKWDGTFNTSIQNHTTSLQNKNLCDTFKYLFLRLKLLYLKQTGRFYSNHGKRVEILHRN